MTVEELLAALQAIIDEADAAGGDLTDQQVERYEELDGQLKRAQKSDEIQKRHAAYKTVANPGVHVTGTAKQDGELERAFDAYMRTGVANQDIAELRAQGTGNTAGGYMIPETFRQKLTERLKAFGGLANEVETISTSGGEPMRWPTIDDTANSGVIAAEGVAPGSGGADLVFGEKTLGAFRYTAPGTGQLPLRVSVELLQDSAFDVQGLVQRKLGERIARVQAVDWVSGVGTTKPFGINTSTGTAQTFTAAAITYDALVDAVHSVDPDYRANARWVFSDQTLAAVRKVVDANARPLWLPADASGMTELPGGTLLGYPVVIDQAFPAYTDGVVQTFGVFGDVREGYVIRRVQDVTLIVNPYSQANAGQVEYTLWARADGVVQNPNSFSLLKNAI